MGIKYLKLDENGNKVQSHAYDKDAIAYEVSKSRGLSSYIIVSIYGTKVSMEKAFVFHGIYM